MTQLGCLVRIRSVKPLKGFTVHITFEDGCEKDIDLEPYLHGPVFEPVLKDPNTFRAMKIVGNTIAWDNGADIDPDVLYYDLKPAWMEETEIVMN
ncbi:MAG: DUF2442 domain-containing protein [Anaerolinea sp.]|nr:DUF2442 domain-containing protein [Anaerolinea sp.]